MALLNSIWDDLKYALRNGSMVTKLMALNFAMFVVMKFTYLLLGGFTKGNPDDSYNRFLDYLCIPSDFHQVFFQPWSVITHMFLHSTFWHLVSNLVGLYLFGNIIGDLIGDRRVLPLYLLGGLAGGLFFILSAQLGILSVGGYALGASAAVMALGGASLLLAPDYRVMGAVKVKYMVLVLVLLDITAIAGRYDSGGPIAHTAGFAMGCIFIYQLREGKDWAEKINQLLDKIVRLFSRKQAPVMVREKRKTTAAHSTMKPQNQAGENKSDLSFQEKLDAILDKIKLTGYESLSPEEKDFLYQASQK